MPQPPGPAFKIDHRYDDDLAQFAAQMEHVSTEKQEWLNSVMNNDQPIEFYRGLMAGYAGMLGLMQQMPLTEILTTQNQICALLASKIRRMHALGEE